MKFFAFLGIVGLIVFAQVKKPVNEAPKMNSVVGGALGGGDSTQSKTLDDGQTAAGVESGSSKKKDNDQWESKPQNGI